MCECKMGNIWFYFQIKETSETSSELDFSHKGEIYKPKSDFFTSSDSDEQNYVPVQNPISNKNFAEQLADKLGNIIKQENISEPEVNTRPIQQQSHYGNVPIKNLLLIFIILNVRVFKSFILHLYFVCVLVILFLPKLRSHSQLLYFK